MLSTPAENATSVLPSSRQMARRREYAAASSGDRSTVLVTASATVVIARSELRWSNGTRLPVSVASAEPATLRQRRCSGDHISYKR